MRARTINGIPRDAVAFAAGIHAVSPRTWREIAEALSMLGYGDHAPDALAAAVGDWGIERVDTIGASALAQFLRPAKTAGPAS